MIRAEQADIYAEASLYIGSHDLTPPMISEALGLQPTNTILRGQPLIPGESRYRMDTHNFILKVHHRGTKTDSDSAAALLQRAINEVLLQIESVASKLNRLRDQVSVSLHCAYGSTDGFEILTLPSTLLKRIASLELSLIIIPFLMEKVEREATKGT